ncbi:MAG TPA: 2-amino-4-hydroxy-6-hydroxymethyldihydropteridine diphosphokinase [Methylophilaceae bacterium]|nr:2-amino-4-hydroxy-6-hydroxymethyldihydropteridine diphosphokinase [Methylophilaceae bacterium]
MPRAFIAIGSNLQQPRSQVEKAFEGLSELPQTQLIKRSSLYRTAPVGYDNQPDFINAVAEVSTALGPLELMRALLELELAHGRERPFPNAPRVLDLDLLLYNDTIMDSPELTLPHPRMHTRGFVLLPLSEIAPNMVIPQHGKVAELAQKCMDQGVEKLAD